MSTNPGTFKCLTNINAKSTHPRSVPLKSKFSKLTLTSSEKKPHDMVDIQPIDPTLTPTPRMLSFSPEITDDENNGDNVAAVPLNRATSTTLKMVNKILVSSGSTGDVNEPRVGRQPGGIANPCEGPSFSQPLLLNDTDITNCTELDGRRSNRIASPRRSSLLAAVNVAEMPSAEAATGDEFDETMSNMEKLEITASSSEDLFNSGGNESHQLSVLSIPHQQRRQTVYTISSGSSRSSTPTSVQNRSTRSTLPSEDVYDVITLSDSQSENDDSIVDGDADVGDRQAANQQVNTPYDADESFGISNCELPVAQNTEDRLCNLSSATSSPSIILPSSVSQAAVPAIAGPAPSPSVAGSLQSMVQHRLDNFFDNIPLLSSNEPMHLDASFTSLSSRLSLLPLNAAPEQPPEADKSDSHGNVSVYVSETDEDEYRTGAELPHDRVEGPIRDVAAESEPDDISPLQQQEQQNPQETISDLATVPSKLTATTSASTLSSAPRKPMTGKRTPTVSISAKFKIRIQVNHNDTSESSSSSTSRPSSSAPSDSGASTTSQAGDESASADVEVHQQAHRMSQMCIGVQQTPDNMCELQPQTATPADSCNSVPQSSCNLPKFGTPDRPITAVRSGDGTPKSRQKLQLNTPRMATSDSSSDAEHVQPGRPFAAVQPVESNVGTPKTQKKLQLDKLRTPRSVASDTPSDAENVPHLSTEPTVQSNTESPKIRKKLQLDKLKTPCPPVAFDPQSDAENVPQFAPPLPPVFATPAKSKLVLDDAAQKLLNELYGVSWQTPELLKKCVIRREPMAAKMNTATKATKQRPPVRVAGVGGSKEMDERHKTLTSPTLDQSQYCQDFSIFRRNIDSHLDSTRIDKQRLPANSTVDPNQNTPLTAIDGRQRNCQLKLPVGGESDANVSSRSDSVMRRCRLKTQTPSRNRILSTSSSDGNNSDADRNGTKSADNYTPTDVSSSDDEYVPGANKAKSKISTTVKRNNANPNNLTYLDLTQCQVVTDEDHTDPDASDLQLQQISEKLLAELELAQSGRLTDNADDATIRKRKLYNKKCDSPEPTPEKPIAPLPVNRPQQAASQDESDESNDEDKLIEEDPSLRVKIRGLLLPRFLPPTNRRLDSLKRNEMPPPPPPIVKQQLTAEIQSLDPQPAANPIIAFKTTPASDKKTPSRSGKASTPSKNTTPTTLAEICRTPEGKYPFLQSLDEHISEHLIHPVARQFRDKFRTKKQLLTALLMELYVDRIFTGEYRRLANVPVTWNAKLQTTAGRCRMLKRAGVRTAAVELSDKVCTSADRLRCTLIHELCHAATWLFQGETGHGRTWKRWASRSNAVLRELPTIERCHAYDIAYKYVYQCTLCGAKSPSHSKSRKVEQIRCAFCHGAIQIYTNKRTPGGGQELCPLEVRKVTGFAAYVKAEYGRVKQPSIGHADVMRLLSAGYAKLTADEKKQY